MPNTFDKPNRGAAKPRERKLVKIPVKTGKFVQKPVISDDLSMDGRAQRAIYVPLARSMSYLLAELSIRMPDYSLYPTKKFLTPSVD